MTHVTHRGPQRLVRLAGLAAIATLALGLAGCGTAGAGPSGDGGSGLPSASPGDGAGTLGELPAGGGTDAASTPPLPAPPSPLPVAAAPEDCVSYNAANLTVAALGDAWILKDGSHNMKLFDTKTDAEDGLKVARNWTQMCFIGRDNDKPDRYRYIINYWRNPSGLPPGLAPTFDCITYNPALLTIYSGAAHPADPNQDEWALYSGGTPLLFLASEPDALRAKIVATGNTRLCVIGHGNDRPDPARYRMYHWRQ